MSARWTKRGAVWLALSLLGCTRDGDAPAGSGACPPCPPCASTSTSAAAPSASASAAPRVAAAPAPSVFHYGAEGDLSTEPMGLFATGLAIADIDGDGRPDLVVANGNDKGLQSVAVYLNDARKGFPSRPSWLSDDLDSNSNVAVGDIDGDGGLDVAVSVLCGRGGINEPSGGAVKVYMSRVGPDGKRALEKRPSFRTDDSFGSFGCALADVDGDGDLDLVASSIFEADGAGGPLRVYLNDHGKLAARPSWTSEDRMLGGVPRVADVDQDGFLDVAVPAEHARLYQASVDGSGAVRLGRAPAWTSSDGSATATYLDVGPIGADPHPALVVSYNDICFRFGTPCGSSHLRAYRPPGRDPVWSSDDGGLGSGIALDLIAGRWGFSRDDGAPLVIYQGDERAFSPAPAFTSGTRSVVETVAVGSLARNPAPPPVVDESFAIDKPRAVVTLSRQVIAAVHEVQRNGVVLSPAEYTRVPGGNWISFARRLVAGDRVQVRYAHVDAPDIAVANFSAQSKGNYVFFRGRKKQ
jgi:hypothetical protein